MKKLTIFLLFFASLFITSKINASPITDLYEENNMGIMPSTGDITALVVPVCFNDAKCEIDNITLESVFNKDNSVIKSNYSLHEYYLESSNNKLNIKADIVKTPFITEKSSMYYEDKYGYTGAEQIIYNYFSSLENFDVSKYDSNNDNIIDALYFIYDHATSSNSDLWWAFTAEFNSYRNPTFIKNFCWIGYDFFSLNTVSGGVYRNSSVLIHETGHLLGLDDYYDYYSNTGAPGGLGYYDIMDSNIGDHNAFSKLLLGWYDDKDIIWLNTHNYEKLTDKIVLSDDNVLIITLETNNLFTEYFIVEYIDPDYSLNSYLTSYIYNSEDKTLEKGFKIYHVKAEKGINEDSSYLSFFYYNNSDTTYKLIDILEANVLTNTKKSNDFLITSNTFFKNEKLDSETYASFNYYNGLDVPVELKFSIIEENYEVTPAIDVKMLDHTNITGAPRFENVKETVEVKRNGTIKKDKNIKAYDALGNDISDDIKIIGYYNEHVPGTYKLAYKVSDGTYTSYQYFNVEVLNTADNSFMVDIVIFCVVALIFTCALGTLKVLKDRKKLTKLD